MSETVLLKDLFEEAERKYGRRAVVSKKGGHLKRSKKNTGLLNVYRVSCSSCKRKFMYHYVINKNSKKTAMNSTKILNLKEKVLDAGLEWRVVDEYWAKQTAKEDDIPLSKLH